MTRLRLSVDAPPVAVVRAGRQFLLVAARPIPAGDALFEIQGEECAEPNQWSVQVAAHVHIVVPDSADLESQLDRYPWRFMNHSCEPNARVDGRRVLAVRPISPGDEITFHYNSTEWEMAAPFECRCGSTHCGGVIQGYRHLSDEERARLQPIAARHLPA